MRTRINVLVSKPLDLFIGKVMRRVYAVVVVRGEKGVDKGKNKSAQAQARQKRKRKHMRAMERKKVIHPCTRKTNK